MFVEHSADLMIPMPQLYQIVDVQNYEILKTFEVPKLTAQNCC